MKKIITTPGHVTAFATNVVVCHLFSIGKTPSLEDLRRIRRNAKHELNMGGLTAAPTALSDNKHHIGIHLNNQ